MTTVPSLPFGRHKGTPLPDTPTDYLRWLLRTCKLSTGLRAAVAAELQARGIETPPPAPPRPLGTCHAHPQAGVVCRWFEDAIGRRRISAHCRRCGRTTDHPPCVPPYTTEADRHASAAPILDALVRLDALGIELASDGRTVWLQGEDYRRVPPDLQAIVRQCRHQLATMIGNRKRAG
jgi:hypothetical protein